MVAAQATTKPPALAREHFRLVGIVGLVIGPLIMSTGDLLHPQESADAARQAAIIAEQPDRWYLAHVLLFIGFVILIPGLLTLTGEAVARWPRAGLAARLLVVCGTSGLTAIFAAEMLAGRLGSTDPAATTKLLEALFSSSVVVPILIVGLGFFIGTAIVAIRMIRDARPLRWPAIFLLAGLLLVMAEIASSQVVLSQIGNVMIWLGTLGFAWRLRRAATPTTEQRS